MTGTITHFFVMKKYLKEICHMATDLVIDPKVLKIYFRRFINENFNI